MPRIGAICLLFILRGVSSACECVYEPPCARINHTAAIFIGRVIHASNGTFRFAVEEAFKGIDKGTLEVDVHAGLCVAMYETGKRYLMLAGRWDDGPLYSGDCTGSVPVEGAEDDIKFIRAWAQGKRMMFLQGRTAANIEDHMVRYELDIEHTKPLSGVELIATKDGRQYRGVSDAGGFFRISVPEPGSYQVVAHRDGLSSTEAEYEFSVEPGSCVEQDIGMWTDSRLSGHVRDLEGQPVAGIPVQITPASEDDDRSPQTASTKADGAFEFRKIPPGEYILGVNPNGLNSKVPYAPRYYPGVSRREGATTIKIEGNQTIPDLDFTIEPRQTTRRIAVGVYWPDGKPVTNASIMCQSQRSDDSRFKHDRIRRYTNSKGEAVCEVLADRDFEVEADRLSWTSSSRPVQPIDHRQRVVVRAGTTSASVRIVVDKMNDISDKESPEDMSQFNDEKDEDH
jgi:hypothetical protein